MADASMRQKPLRSPIIIFLLFSVVSVFANAVVVVVFVVVVVVVVAAVVVVVIVVVFVVVVVFALRYIPVDRLRWLKRRKKLPESLNRVAFKSLPSNLHS